MILTLTFALLDVTCHASLVPSSAIVWRISSYAERARGTSEMSLMQKKLSIAPCHIPGCTPFPFKSMKSMLKSIVLNWM